MICPYRHAKTQGFHQETSKTMNQYMLICLQSCMQQSLSQLEGEDDDFTLNYIIFYMILI